MHHICNFVRFCFNDNKNTTFKKKTKKHKTCFLNFNKKHKKNIITSMIYDTLPVEVHNFACYAEGCGTADLSTWKPADDNSTAYRQRIKLHDNPHSPDVRAPISTMHRLAVLRSLRRLPLPTLTSRRLLLLTRLLLWPLYMGRQTSGMPFSHT